MKSKYHFTLKFNRNKKYEHKNKNIAFVFAKEEGPVDNEHHMLYTVTGKGKATMFQNGNAIEGTWEKMTATDRLKFVDEKGSEIPLVRGQIWIEVLPAGNDISY